MASKRVLSVELGVQTTRICEIDYNGKKKTIVNTCVFDTPEGTVEDGYVRNKDILAVSIKAAMQKKLMTAKEVIFSISSSKISNREVNMPFLPDKQIGDYIKTNAKDYIVIPEIEKYVITHKKLEEITDAEGKKLRILVLAAPNDLIETYYELSQVMGLQIIAIDYAGNSSYQVLKRQNYRGVNVIVQLNEASTLINIMKGNVLLLQRTVAYGVNSVVDAAMACGEFDIIDRKTAMDKLLSDTLVNPKLNESAIDDVALSYMDSNNDVYSQQIKQMKAKDQVTDAFNYLINNTIRVLDYYTSKFPEERVENIYLAGIGSRIKGILPLFKNEVFSEIKRIENVIGVDFSKNCGITNDEKSDYIVVAGACIDAVDFVPKAYAEDMKNKQTDVFANRIAIAVGIIGVGILVYFGGNYIINKAANSALKTRKNQLASVETLLSDIERAELSLNNAKGVYVGTMEFSYLINAFFEEIQGCIPSGTKFESFTYQKDSITIDAKATSFEQVGEFVKNLKECTLVGSVAVNGISVAQDKGVVVYEFSAIIAPRQMDYSLFIDKNFTPSLKSIEEALGITKDTGEGEEKEEKEETEE
ncbi:MAG: hypothetical protein E7262_04950 [Lachnospiraceae bacterium]|nr:hypothetical protein [Lachnospiraceae bacterium]